MDLHILAGIFIGLSVALGTVAGLKLTVRPTKANRYIARVLKERGL